MEQKYPYQNPDSNQSHDYLFPSVEPFLMPLPPGSRVLDLGCGNGSFVARFRGRGWELYGTDFSQTGIEIARKSFEGVHYFPADFTTVSPEEILKTCGGPFDAIISTEVVEHVYLPRTYAKLSFELLKPGGYAVISTPYHGYLKNVVLAVTGKLDRHFTVLWDYGHIKFWSKKTLSQLLTEVGFATPKFVGSGRLPWLWKSMVATVQKPVNP